MKKLYTLILENAQGEIRNVEVMAKDINHALQRLDNACELADADKLKDPANWKGQALGVTGLGSATDFLTRALAAKAGLKNQDYSLVPVGAGDTFLAAMQQGKIVSGMTTEPTVARAVKAGATLIREVQDQFYGDRSGMVACPFGYRWFLAAAKEEVTPQEMQRRWNTMLEGGKAD